MPNLIGQRRVVFLRSSCEPMLMMAARDAVTAIPKGTEIVIVE